MYMLVSRKNPNCLVDLVHKVKQHPGLRPNFVDLAINQSDSSFFVNSEVDKNLIVESSVGGNYGGSNDVVNLHDIPALSALIRAT